MERFHDSLSTLDQTKMLTCWDFPVEITLSERTIKLDEPQHMRNSLKALHEFYAAQGITSVRGEILFIHETNDAEAICASKFQAMTSKGRLYAQWTSSYLLKNSIRGWRLTKGNISNQFKALKLSREDEDVIYQAAELSSIN